MNILLTGGLGFQGIHLARLLVERGDRVTVFNTPSQRAQRNLRVLKDWTEGREPIRVVWGSVTDPEIAEKMIAAGYDAVVHLAAQTSVDVSIADSNASVFVNVLGTWNVLEAVRKHARATRLLVVSSCEVYGDQQSDAALGVRSPLLPHSPYAATKAAADRLAHAYWRTHDLNVVIVRPCNIFGPHQKAGGDGAVIPTMVNAARGGGLVRVTGTGLQEREYLYVTDAVRAYAVLLDREDGGTWTLGSGQRVSMLDIAGAVARRYAARIEHASARLGEVSAFTMAPTVLNGWTPEVSFWVGLDRYFAWTDALL